MTFSFTFPSDVFDFESQTAEDATALFGNITALWRNYQQRAQDAKEHEETLSGLLEQAKGNVDRLRAHRDQLQAALNTALGNPGGPPPPSPPPPPPPARYEARSEKIPDPPMFNGSRTALPSFTLKLRSKFRTNGDRFMTETARVDYAVSWLEGKALDMVMGQLNEETEELDIPDVAALLTLLKTAFGDPDVTSTGRRELHQLRQGKRDFATYHPDFTRIVGRLRFNDEAKRDALEQGMNEDLKEAMVTVMEDVSSYTRYVAVLQLLDNKIRARKEEKAGRRMGSFIAFHTNTSNSAGHPSHSPGGLAPMDLSTLRNLGTARPPSDQRYVQIKGRSKLAPAEKQWRMDNGRCAFCAEAGHTFQQCPAGN